MGERRWSSIEFDLVSAQDADAQLTTIEVWNPLDGLKIRLPTELAYVSGPPGPSRIDWLGGVDGELADARGALVGFMKLGDARDDQIVRFSKRYGVLGICPHGNIATHPGKEGRTHSCSFLCRDERVWEKDWVENHEWEGVGAEGGPERWDHFVKRGGRHWEPIAAWRCHARKFRAIWRICLAIREGAPTTALMWRDVCSQRRVLVEREGTPDEPYAVKNQRWKAARQALANSDTWLPLNEADLPSSDSWLRRAIDDPTAMIVGVVDTLIRDAGITVSMAWSLENPTSFRPTLALEPLRLVERQMIANQGVALFPALVAELIAFMARSDLMMCSICGNEFDWTTTYKKTPQSGYRRYCSEACRRLGRRQTHRKYEAGSRKF